MRSPREVPLHEVFDVVRCDHAVAATMVQDDRDTSTQHGFDHASAQGKDDVSLIDNVRKVILVNNSETHAREGRDDVQSSTSLSYRRFRC